MEKRPLFRTSGLLQYPMGDTNVIFSGMSRGMPHDPSNFSNNSFEESSGSIGSDTLWPFDNGMSLNNFLILWFQAKTIRVHGSATHSTAGAQSWDDTGDFYSQLESRLRINDWDLLPFNTGQTLLFPWNSAVRGAWKHLELSDISDDYFPSLSITKVTGLGSGGQIRTINPGGYSGPVSADFTAHGHPVGGDLFSTTFDIFHTSNLSSVTFNVDVASWLS